MFWSSWDSLGTCAFALILVNLAFVLERQDEWVNQS
jgi:hypothetical protein